mmetsp:Transcript_8391/g.12928  ORF Transcript_8391/g.12928 Transcript_8391/m.12928 type:complete len:299 (+) Transcript_8391:38-934(+)
MGLIDYITSSAVAFTMSGNTGISPFLTLFLMGVLEKTDETLLNMDNWTESLLSSWPGLILFGSLTCVEFVGKCIPAVDAIIDSIEVFVVPVMSVLSTMGSIGLLDVVADAASGRRLGIDDTPLFIFKCCIVFFGAILALLVHFCKLILRLIGLATCAGFCQPCFTILETTSVLSCVMLAVFVKEIAIVTAIIFFALAGYAYYKKFIEKKEQEEGEEEPGAVVDHYVQYDDNDEERPKNEYIQTSPNDEPIAASQSTDKDATVTTPVVVQDQFDVEEKQSSEGRITTAATPTDEQAEVV